MQARSQQAELHQRSSSAKPNVEEEVAKLLLEEVVCDTVREVDRLAVRLCVCGGGGGVWPEMKTVLALQISCQLTFPSTSTSTKFTTYRIARDFFGSYLRIISKFPLK